MGKSFAIKLLPIIIAQLLKMLTPDLMKRLADKVLDAIEEAIQKSENKLDDAFVPVIGMIRSAFNVPDDDV